ncbi:hypothetical protein CANCADRAFT_16042, partial [Tortispora caseinolytica NRRL Y-17796]
LVDLGYTIIALNYTLTDNTVRASCPIPESPFPEFKHITFLRRLTINIDTPSITNNVMQFMKLFDIVAVRPMSEKSFQNACMALDIDIISFDPSARLPLIPKHATVAAAINRGVYFEICYGAGVGNSRSRTQTITNATTIIRIARSRGLIVSSDADTAVACRSPHDVINLLCVWGLDHMRAREAIQRNPCLAAKSGTLRHTSHKQAV